MGGAKGGGNPRPAAADPRIKKISENSRVSKGAKVESR